MVPDFVEWVCDSVNWTDVRVVGFSTTMLQPVASLALARVLKERHPHLKVLFGGAGCSGAMGRALHRNFTFVDGVVDGEADLTIAPLISALLRGSEPTDTPGLLWRATNGQCSQRPSQPVASLADYPVPLYRDYFDQLQQYRFGSGLEVRIPFEASRGCWWAVQSHCLFCGLNGEVLKQRARPVEAIVRELQIQHALHPASVFIATDNIIDPKHLLSLPRRIGHQLPAIEVFFEVRAVMTRDQMSELAKGGIVHLQPGLESLIPEVLEMVKKGTTPIVNLCFLRRARELGINTYWNLLYGLPGERAEWYDALLSKLPQFSHLTAPDVVEFSLERFSPYFDNPAKYGIHIKGPLPGYRFVWNLPDMEIQDLCFDLDFDAPGIVDRTRVGERLRAAVSEWSRSDATFTVEILAGDRVQVIDRRAHPSAGVRILDPLIGLVLRTFEEPITIERACKRILKWDFKSYLRIGGTEGIRRLADSLVTENLLFSECGRYLCLAVPRSKDFWILFEGRHPEIGRTPHRLVAVLTERRVGLDT
jgi:ribosomal peptide maturation radical SAM protein 1